MGMRMEMGTVMGMKALIVRNDKRKNIRFISEI